MDENAYDAPPSKPGQSQRSPIAVWVCSALGAFVGSIEGMAYLGRPFGMGDNTDVWLLGALVGGSLSYKLAQIALTSMLRTCGSDALGVTLGLLLTGFPFGFMALLGVIALGGELIKNQIVDLSKILAEIDQGKTPYHAILDGGTSKMWPVCMVVLTTVLGSIPLLKDPFFGAMAVCIMFGLSFAAILSLFVTPVLYAIFFSIAETPGAPNANVRTTRQWI